MSEVNVVAIIVALIAGLCSVAGQWIISHQQGEKRKTENAVRDARLDDRLDRVEKRLDEHNKYAEKFGDIQRDIAVIKTEIQNLKGA